MTRSQEAVLGGVLFIVALLCAAFFFPALLSWRFGNDTWQALWIDRWAIVIAIMTLLTIWTTIQWTSIIFPIFLSYIVIEGILSAFIMAFYGTPSISTIPPQHAAMSALLPLFAFLFFLKLPWNAQIIKKQIGWMGIILSLGIIYQALFGGRSQTIQVPFLSNPATTAMCIALACMDITGWAWWLITAAIALTCTTTSAAIWFLFSIFRVGEYQRLVLTSAALFAFMHKRWMDVSGGRGVIWQWYWDFFKVQAKSHLSFGLGLGTSRIWLPMVQQLHGVDLTKQGAYTWAHNDHLQALTELGMVGFFLYILTAIKLLMLSSPRNKLFLIGFGIAMCSLFPLHWTFPCLFLWIVAYEECIKASSPLRSH